MRYVGNMACRWLLLRMLFLAASKLVVASTKLDHGTCRALRSKAHTVQYTPTFSLQTDVRGIRVYCMQVGTHTTFIWMRQRQRVLFRTICQIYRQPMGRWMACSRRQRDETSSLHCNFNYTARTTLRKKKKNKERPRTHRAGGHVVPDGAEKAWTLSNGPTCGGQRA